MARARQSRNLAVLGTGNLDIHTVSHPLLQLYRSLFRKSPLYRSSRYISLMCTRSSLCRDISAKATFHSFIRYKIRWMTGFGKGYIKYMFFYLVDASFSIVDAGLTAGRSGNLRTSSLRNSFVAICKWKGYPQFFTQLSKSYVYWSKKSTFSPSIFFLWWYI